MKSFDSIILKFWTNNLKKSPTNNIRKQIIKELLSLFDEKKKIIISIQLITYGDQLILSALLWLFNWRFSFFYLKRKKNSWVIFSLQIWPIIAIKIFHPLMFSSSNFSSIIFFSGGTWCRRAQKITAEYRLTWQKTNKKSVCRWAGKKTCKENIRIRTNRRGMFLNQQTFFNLWELNFIWMFRISSNWKIYVKHRIMWKIYCYLPFEAMSKKKCYNNIRRFVSVSICS